MRTFRSPVTRDFGRIAPFSDAVVAVALTALVLPLLDIKIDQTGGWGTFFRDYGSELSAFLYGFFVIAIYWAVHHKIWGAAQQCTRVLLWLNLFWLLGIVLIPFGSVALIEVGDQPALLGSQIYCAILMWTSLTTALIIYVISNDQRISAGLIPVQPLWWSMRYIVTWGGMWLAIVVFGQAALPFLWIPGVLMFVLSRPAVPGRRADTHDDESRQPNTSQG